jgi:hypothetical protein
MITKPVTTPMAYGFKDFNGNTWHKAAVDAYNVYNVELERARHPSTIEFLLDQRHRMFVLIMDDYNTRQRSSYVPRIQLTIGNR